MDRASQRGQDRKVSPIGHEFNDFGVSTRSFWAQVWMPEAMLQEHGSSQAKCCEKVAKMAAPGTPLGPHWGSEGHAWEALGTVCLSLWLLRVVFCPIFDEKCDFGISMPLCSRIATFGRLGDQVGAIRAQKSRPSGQKSPQRGNSGQSGQSSQSGRSGLAVGAMETVGKNPEIKSSQGTKSI